MAPGDVFKIDMDTGTLGSQDRQRWGLGVAAQPIQFLLTATTVVGETANGDYVTNDHNGSHDTGVRITDQGIHCEFTLTDANGDYSLAITPLISGATTTTLTGQIVNPGSLSPGLTMPPNTLFLASDSGGPDAGQGGIAGTHYYNNIQIVPEPAAAGLVAAAVLALLRRRRV